MAVQAGTQESTFYCLINPVQDVWEPCFYLLPCRVHFIFFFRQTAFHLSHPGLKRHLSHIWHQREGGKECLREN